MFNPRKQHSTADPSGRTPVDWVLPLDRLTGAELAQVGGKAANLGRMLQAGLPVPGGFCVTTAAFRLWIEGQPKAVSLLDRLAQLAPAAGSEIHDTVGALRQVLAASPVPEPVEGGIRAAAGLNSYTAAMRQRKPERPPKAGRAPWHQRFG
ncbi:MAG: PEP/pyruvate-binding domain-containing protein [Limisphaerales bacterium]